MEKLRTNSLGYPRIGDKRQLKKAVEAYWKGELSRETLLQTGAKLRERNWRRQLEAGVDLIPSNDFSFYDQVLDMSCLLGNTPPRFERPPGNVNIDTMFRVARGVSRQTGLETGMQAAEMTKWFDTNYHYIVPEFTEDTTFGLSAIKVFDEFSEAKALDILTKPVLLGPVSYLLLGKVTAEARTGFDRFEHLEAILRVYETILARLNELGAEWVQIDEPILATDLEEKHREALIRSHARLSAAAKGTKIMATTYFGELRGNLDTFLTLPADALHIDAVRGRNEFTAVISQFPEDKILSLGVVDGRNVWKNNYEDSLELIDEGIKVLGGHRLILAGSCSFLHVPVSLQYENRLEADLKDWLAFADEKLDELADLRDLAANRISNEPLKRNREAHRRRRKDARTRDGSVRERAAAVTDRDRHRPDRHAIRRAVQRQRLNLPDLPATTIGSFPQTREVRAQRARYRKGRLNENAYDAFIKTQIRECVAAQEALGLDMLVHGEFERNDMVEYFGEQLDGFGFTEFGWVQSFGTRCVKPPIIYGDIKRPRPMTIYWSEYAQSLTDRPMKGMLTGPVTILQWSFVRDDQPRSETAEQIALAIRDETVDLEAAGLPAIQIDEPALREGLPLRLEDRAEYLDWAVNAFRLASSGVRNDTQIHTHMCYSEFNDIIETIAALDADVITIETARSHMELLDAFAAFEYPNEIGPGVYDIHSPRLPSAAEMETLLEKAMEVIDPGRLWVNPDCGLKTRSWDEVKPALENMMAAARNLRQKTRVSGAIQ